MKIIYGLVAFACGVFVTVSIYESTSSPPKEKLCTIKLNDSNKVSSYLTGECA
jgi:hypothetical protein